MYFFANQSADIGLWSLCSWLPHMWHNPQICTAQWQIHCLLSNLLCSRPSNRVLLSWFSIHQLCFAGEWYKSDISESQHLLFLGRQVQYKCMLCYTIYIQTYAICMGDRMHGYQCVLVTSFFLTAEKWVTMHQHANTCWSQLFKSISGSIEWQVSTGNRFTWPAPIVRLVRIWPDDFSDQYKKWSTIITYTMKPMCQSLLVKTRN